MGDDAEGEIEMEDVQIEEASPEGVQSGENYVIANLWNRWYQHNDYESFKRLCEIAKQLDGKESDWTDFDDFLDKLMKRTELVTDIRNSDKGLVYLTERQKREKRMEWGLLEKEINAYVFKFSKNFNVFRRVPALGRILEDIVKKEKGIVGIIG